ncbi:MAG: MotA/TolQ/ExbB proton channel family protein [Endomicrobiales bacterium]|nr:MotA/TolQ/ExbB proton channel family protein [Endomicrobiales bacterium]
MFEGKTLWQIFNFGGPVMYVLLFCSIFSIAVILNRIIYYARVSKTSREDFIAEVVSEIKAGNFQKAIEVCKNAQMPFANVVLSGLKLRGHGEKMISNALEREVTIEVIKLEKYTSVVGTIGNISLYIGLFGTIIGVVRAFHDISSVGTGGISTVIGGVSEALVATATGLMVAIPAVVAYNYFVKRIDQFVNDMELCASELLDALSE